MEPIRILNVVGRMDRGGIETMIMNIYRNIDRNKVQFDFLAHYGKEADYNDEIRSLGGKIYEMPVIKTTEKTYYNKFFQYRRALIEFFKNHQEYKVLHGHMTNTASIYMPIAKKYGNINCLISHSHLTRARQGLTGTVTNILQIPLRKCATEYFSCSNEAGKWLYKKKDFDNGKVRIVKNAIDSDLFVYNYEKRKKKREELGINGNLVLGHIGRFFEQKNHDFLIDVFNEVYKMNDKAVLILIGEGVLMTEIKGKVNKFGLDKNVIFLGLRSDIPELLQAMDVFVFPSHFEGLPLVGIEAQASGLPCIMSTAISEETNVTGLIDFFSLESGAKIWADAILKKMENFNRIDTKQKIIDSGYDVKESSKMLQEFYLEKSK